jgi:glutathione S-transferase
MKFDAIRLHHFPGVRSARVAWMLHELELPFDIVLVHLFEGQQYTPSFLALNPYHALPVVEFDRAGQTTRMVESGALVAMLADLIPEAGLAPHSSDFPARCAYMQALHQCGSTFDMMLWQIRLHEDILPPDQRDARTAKRYRNKFSTEAEPQLAAKLGTTAFICGDSFTAADCMVGHAIIWARRYRLCEGSLFEAYLGRLSARSAFQRAFADARGVDLRPANLGRVAAMVTG